MKALPGIHVARRDLEAVLADYEDGSIILMDEEGSVDGPDLPSHLRDSDSATFVLGDSRGLTEEQLVLMRDKNPIEVRLGPLSLHVDHCIAIVHNILDRAIGDD